MRPSIQNPRTVPPNPSIMGAPCWMPACAMVPRSGARLTACPPLSFSLHVPRPLDGMADDGLRHLGTLARRGARRLTGSCPNGALGGGLTARKSSPNGLKWLFSTPNGIPRHKNRRLTRLCPNGPLGSDPHRISTPGRGLCIEGCIRKGFFEDGPRRREQREASRQRNQ